MLQPFRLRFAPSLLLTILLGCGGGIDVPADPAPDGAAETSGDETSGGGDTGGGTDTAGGDDTLSGDTSAGDTFADDTTSDGPPDETSAETSVETSAETSAETSGDIGSDGIGFDSGSDTAVADDGPPPTGCAGTALAVDPASTLDPLKDGGLSVGHFTFTVPTLGPLTSVKVRATYPALADKTTPHPGRHAWVMFHHAVHCDTSPCTGVVYDEYDGIFDRWASHGFVVFSIDGSKIFFPTSSGTGLSWPQQKTVAGMMDEAITYFLAQQETTGFTLHCALDANRTAVSGHSRGGGAALLVTTARTDAAKIKAYVGFQPVDPEITSGAPFPAPVPGYDIPALWLDSNNDGDVSYPIVAMQYERARFKATHVAILGSKHTYTLDKPYPDQGGLAATITPDEHKRVCHYYSIPFLRAYVRDAAATAADLDRVSGASGMSIDSTVSTGNATIRWRWPSTTFPYLELFDEDVGTTPTKTVAGDPITLVGGMTASIVATHGGFGGTVGQLIRAVHLNWSSASLVDAAIDVPLPAGALTGKKAIVFETETLSSVSTTSGTHPMFIEITDTTGAKASISVDSIVGTGWSSRPRRLSAAYAPLSKFTGVDLAKAKSVRLVAKAGTANADIYVDLLRVE